MRAVIVIACLGLLAVPESASADPTVSLTVSRHPSVRAFSEDEVKGILRRASAVMRRAGCNVTFELGGPVRSFASSSTPDVIRTPRQLDQVHGEETDVKIVKEIKCCRETKGTFTGCAWPPQANSRSIILAESGATLGNLWAHELGHRMGLEHRDDRRDLMTKRGVDASSVRLTQKECRCYQNAGSCTLPPQTLPPPERRCPSE